MSSNDRILAKDPVLPNPNEAVPPLASRWSIQNRARFHWPINKLIKEIKVQYKTIDAPFRNNASPVECYSFPLYVRFKKMFLLHCAYVNINWTGNKTGARKPKIVNENLMTELINDQLQLKDTYVERTSEGRSVMYEGMELPVRNCATSLVKVLQLCSNRRYLSPLSIQQKRTAANRVTATCVYLGC